MSAHLDPARLPYRGRRLRVPIHRSARDRKRFERGRARTTFRFTCIGAIRHASFGLRVGNADGTLRPLRTRVTNISRPHPDLRSDRDVLDRCSFAVSTNSSSSRDATPHRFGLCRRRVHRLFSGIRPPHADGGVLHLGVRIKFVALLAGAFLNNPWTLIPILGATLLDRSQILGILSFPPSIGAI